jgi:phosphate starvation-inducible PhoH-like protein
VKVADGTQHQVVISVSESPEVAASLWGPQDTHRKLLERRLGVRLGARGGQVTLSGRPDRVRLAERVIEQLVRLAEQGKPLFLEDVDRAVRLLEADSGVALDEMAQQAIGTTTDRRAITPKTPNQQLYLDAIEQNDLTFAVGPAGTGKTYLAMAAAMAALKRREVKRLILARPAVEAGERLGFLPGTLVEKVNPYLRPLYDALYDMLDIERAGRLVESGTIEVAPLAFMRGRTLNHSFVILDEAQNTTRDQMKMFLTRLGQHSHAVVTGDVTQTDLPPGVESGLVHAVRILEGVKGIGMVHFTRQDVVRHPLVQAIIEAYERDEGPR